MKHNSAAREYYVVTRAWPAVKRMPCSLAPRTDFVADNQQRGDAGLPDMRHPLGEEPDPNAKASQGREALFHGWCIWAELIATYKRRPAVAAMIMAETMATRAVRRPVPLNTATAEKKARTPMPSAPERPMKSYPGDGRQTYGSGRNLPHRRYPRHTSRRLPAECTETGRAREPRTIGN